MKKLVLAGLLCGLLCSCSHRLVDFTLISTKNVPMDQTLDLAKADKRVKGEDSKGIVLSVPLGMPNMKPRHRILSGCHRSEATASSTPKGGPASSTAKTSMS